MTAQWHQTCAQNRSRGGSVQRVARSGCWKAEAASERVGEITEHGLHGFERAGCVAPPLAHAMVMVSLSSNQPLIDVFARWVDAATMSMLVNATDVTSKDRRV